MKLALVKKLTNSVDAVESALVKKITIKNFKIILKKGLTNKNFYAIMNIETREREQ